MYIWLVVWNLFLFFHILGTIFPTDNFSEGLKPPTIYIHICIYIYTYIYIYIYTYIYIYDISDTVSHMAFCPNMMTKEIWGYPMCRQRLMAKVKRSPMILICCIKINVALVQFLYTRTWVVAGNERFPDWYRETTHTHIPRPIYLYNVWHLQEVHRENKEHWKPKRLISNSDKWNGKWYFRHLSNRIQPQHVHVCVCMHQWIYNCNYQKQNTPRDMCTNRQQTHLHWWCHNPQPSKTLIFYSKRRKGFVFLAYWDISDPFLWAPV